jgi:HEAT repeat protein
MTSRLCCLLCILLLGGLAAEAAAAEILSNQDVVALIEAGLNEELVKRKIQASQNDFDVSAEAMVRLRKSGVPDEIISLMLTQTEKQKSQRENRLAMQIQYLASPRPEARQQAYLALLRMGGRARERLIGVVSEDGNPAVRAAAAEALARMGEEEAVPVLTVLLEDPDPAVRAAAGAALADLAPEQATTLALRRLREWDSLEEEAPVSAHLRIVERLDLAKGAEAALRVLQKGVRPGDRAAAAEALGRLGEQGAVEALEQALRHDRDAAVRAAAAQALGRLGVEDAVESLLAALQRDAENRPELIRVMARFNPEKVVPILITLVDPQLPPPEAEALTETLRRLTRRDFGLDRRRWLKWWEEHEAGVDKPAGPPAEPPPADGAP